MIKIIKEVSTKKFKLGDRVSYHGHHGTIVGMSEDEEMSVVLLDTDAIEGRMNDYSYLSTFDLIKTFTKYPSEAEPIDFDEPDIEEMGQIWGESKKT